MNVVLPYICGVQWLMCDDGPWSICSGVYVSIYWPLHCTLVVVGCCVHRCTMYVRMCICRDRTDVIQRSVAAMWV